MRPRVERDPSIGRGLSDAAYASTRDGGGEVRAAGGGFCNGSPPSFTAAGKSKVEEMVKA